MNIKSITLAVSTLILSSSVNSAILDFDVLISSGSGLTYVGDSYTEDGFSLTAIPCASCTNGFYAYQTESLQYTGSPGLVRADVSGGIVLENDLGNSFDLISIDLSSGDQNHTGLIPVAFYGSVGGDVVTQVFWFNSDLDGVSTTFTFNDSFKNITTLYWEQGAIYHQFDNIVLSSVPVPAGAWLFGSGLIGLIGIARRKKT